MTLKDIQNLTTAHPPTTTCPVGTHGKHRRASRFTAQLEASLPGFKPPTLPLASCVTLSKLPDPLSLSFLINKMRKIIIPSSQICGED